MPDTNAEHLSRLQLWASLFEADCDDRYRDVPLNGQDVAALRWAIARLSRLTIADALALAREGRRVRTPDMRDEDSYVRFGGTYFALVTEDEEDFYEPSTDDCEAEWEEVPHAD